MAADSALVINSITRRMLLSRSRSLLEADNPLAVLSEGSRIEGLQRLPDMPSILPCSFGPTLCLLLAVGIGGAGPREIGGSGITMRIGITFDLKGDDLLADVSSLPDDFQEEFDSPATIEAIAAALSDLGHEVMLLGNGRAMLERVLADPPDFVFNIAEGHGVSRCREARVPAVLEMLGIPCTGSDPLTLAVTLDKDCAKRLVAAEGVAVAPGFVIGADDDPREITSRLSFPAIAKPAWEGSSKGIRKKCLVRAPGELVEVVAVASPGSTAADPGGRVYSR